jgi:cytochrome c-type biogenesis protein CcmF
MIPELGHFALILALLMALIQAVLPLYGAHKNDEALMRLSRATSYILFMLITLAFASLIIAALQDDFSVLSVVENSHTLKPVLYKIAGVWGNHEGSLVLWVLILSLYGALFASSGRAPLPLKARTLAVQGMIAAAFLLYILFTSDPFIRLWPAPANGNDLNPLLQDPGLAFHPPCLYLGYVGFSIVFSFAVAALLEGRCDRAWATHVKPWALAAWSALTLGIGMGSWWAYYTLGWGGWWFWDPVENASLMPWLAGTALLHSLIVVERREALKGWTLLLAILTFSLSLLGTFLVRSGVLNSVHAFASDPTRGIFILILLTLTVGGALTLYALRAGRLEPGRLFAPISREGALLLNNLFLATATATVFTGTLYPLFLAESEGQTVSIGPPYFKMTVIPLAIPFLILMAIGPMLHWKRDDAKGALQRLRFAMIATVLVAVAVLALKGVRPAMAPIGIALASWIFFGALTEPVTGRFRLSRHRWGMVLAHAGLGISIAGMTGSALWMSEKTLVIHPNEVVPLAGYEVTFAGAKPVAGPNYTATEATVPVTHKGKIIATLRPERRFYPVQGRFTTVAAIHTDLMADLYVTLGEVDPVDRTAYVMHIYHHPLVPWIWLGGAVMALGGIVSLTARTRIMRSSIR